MGHLFWARGQPRFAGTHHVSAVRLIASVLPHYRTAQYYSTVKPYYLRLESLP